MLVGHDEARGVVEGQVLEQDLGEEGVRVLGGGGGRK